MQALTGYLAAQKAAGVPVKHISRHVLGLFQGMPGAKRWRRYISQHAHLDPANDGLLLEALEAMHRASFAGHPRMRREQAAIQASLPTPVQHRFMRDTLE